MKKLLLFLILFASLTIVKGQNYFPMLGDSNTWYVSSAFEHCETAIFSTSGDTNIANRTYRKFFGPNYLTGFVTHLIAFLREDTNQKKVYIKLDHGLSSNDTSEFTFYDYNLITNDSIFLFNPNINNSANKVDTLGWYKVDSTSTINILIGNRKIMYLRKVIPELDYHYDYMRWIEGIGAIDGPYLFMGSCCWSWLSCEYRDTTHEYLSYEVPNLCDCFSIGLQENENNEEFITFPNPCSNYLSIERYGNQHQKCKIIIYDILGKKIKEEVTSNKNIDIDVSELNDGVFLLTLQTEEKIFYKKLIKSKTK